MPIYDVKLFHFQAGHATLTDCLTGNLRGYEPQDNETMIEKKFSLKGSPKQKAEGRFLQ